jgi:hypothetical protein
MNELAELYFLHQTLRDRPRYFIMKSIGSTASMVWKQIAEHIGTLQRS